jgi:hypothetical protein
MAQAAESLQFRDDCHLGVASSLGLGLLGWRRKRKAEPDNAAIQFKQAKPPGNIPELFVGAECDARSPRTNHYGLSYVGFAGSGAVQDSL